MAFCDYDELQRVKKKILAAHTFPGYLSRGWTKLDQVPHLYLSRGWTKLDQVPHLYLSRGWTKLDQVPHLYFSGGVHTIRHVHIMMKKQKENVFIKEVNYIIFKQP